MAARIAGVLELQVNGEIHAAKGDFTVNLGAHKRSGIKGSDGRLHGFREEPQLSYLEGKITVLGTTVVSTILNLIDATATLKLANGKTYVFRNAYYAGDGNITTGEAEMDFRLECESAEEI
jgi:hypothetical protein